jgi:hypothetical protein
MTSRSTIRAYCNGTLPLSRLFGTGHPWRPIAGLERVAGWISASPALTLQLVPRTITDGFLRQEAHRGQTP